MIGPSLPPSCVQWGSGFPNRWIWAEGQEAITGTHESCNSSTSAPFCGGDSGEICTGLEVLGGGLERHFSLHHSYWQYNVICYTCLPEKTFVEAPRTIVTLIANGLQQPGLLRVKT